MFRKYNNMIITSFILLQITVSAMAIHIDNDVIGDPMTECDDNSISFKVQTRKSFLGRLFVRGEASNPDCSASFAGAKANNATSSSFIVPLSKCGMRRLRSSDKSITYSTTVVVSFHPTFVTKVDKAYSIKCRFTKQTYNVTVPLDVSVLPTIDTLSLEANDVVCSYEMRRDSADGPIARFASVGDPIFHIWKCQTEILWILVTDCITTDGTGNKVQLIDENGCTTDNVLISSPLYSQSNNSAVAESLAFKYADKSQMSFQCVLSLCHPDSPECQQSFPPECTPNDVKIASYEMFSTSGNFSDEINATESVPLIEEIEEHSYLNASLFNISELQRSKRELKAFADFSSRDVLSNEMIVLDSRLGLDDFLDLGQIRADKSSPNACQDYRALCYALTLVVSMITGAILCIVFIYKKQICSKNVKNRM